MITYHPLVTASDIPKLDKVVQKRVRLAIEFKLKINPLLYGSPLHRSLKLLWKLRVGDWRVIYTIEPNGVYILAIGHRNDIYKKVLGRL
jgi:mRNA-degrading endonuclease RelE of RelBE toxin-antitoxin system